MSSAIINGWHIYFHPIFAKQRQELVDIVILWLGWPRKKGDKKDCYEVFKKMVYRGEFPDSIEELIAESET